jgi:integrase
MGVVRRADSRFWWLNLERPGQKSIRLSTKIPIVGADALQTKENRQLAESAYVSQMADLARRRFQLPTDKPLITFAKYRAWYLEHISIHKRSHSVEASILKTLGGHFDATALSDITIDMGTEWRTLRARQVMPSTVNREMALLKHLLSSAVPRYLDANPLKDLGPLRVTEQEPGILSQDEEARLLAVTSPEEAAIILCALDTLQRLSSVAYLKRAQDHGAYLNFLNTKTTKATKVPVSKRLRLALDALPASDPYIFSGLHATHTSAASVRSAVKKMFYRTCTQAGIQTGRSGGLTFHCLRHTGASRMLERGTNIETVARIGGWANLEILRRYLHPSDAASIEAVETIGRLK